MKKPWEDQRTKLDTVKGVIILVIAAIVVMAVIVRSRQDIKRFRDETAEAIDAKL